MKFRFLLPLFFVITVFLGCTKTIKEFQNNISYKVVEIQVDIKHNISNLLLSLLDPSQASKLDIVTIVDINNKNSIDIDIKEFKYKIYINNQFIANGVDKTFIKLLANNTTRVKLPISINYLKIIKQQIDFTKEINLKIDGNIVLITPLGEYTLPFKSSKKIIN